MWEATQSVIPAPLGHVVGSHGPDVAVKVRGASFRWTPYRMSGSLKTLKGSIAMGNVTREAQEAWDTHYGEGRTFRPLSDAELTFLRELVPAPPGGGHALDVGCGLGDLARHLAATGYTVDAVDFAASALSIAEQTPPASGTVRFVQCDIERDPLDGLRSSYDLIAFRLSYAFIGDRTRVMHRLRERLRPGGAVVVITPAWRGCRPTAAPSHSTRKRSPCCPPAGTRSNDVTRKGWRSSCCATPPRARWPTAARDARPRTP
ncbi:hypothetical protein Sliba_74160 [Streptomyces nigrescens]|uniref:Methyltransferase domain-containing protein n=1 Tax=Streptomyces nigrescens TaxID=1920 RepID=A0A640TSH5_STRNI|nr:hypothetical protein Sliba_74160 [Streptomyces libani subsp. libani]